MTPSRPPRRALRARVLACTLAVGTAAALGACGSEDTGAPELTWYINPDAGGQARIAQECTQASDGRYRISTSLLPRDAASQREQLARRLAAGDRSMDIMSLDPPFIPELAEPGFLSPVPEELARTASEGVLTGPLEGAKWKDELVTVPFWANTQLLWYRADVAQAAGLDMSRPVTWEQITQAAASQDKHLGVQGQQGESMTVWVNALVESEGGAILENPEAGKDELRTGLDSPAGAKAAEVIGTIGREGLGGPGLPTSDENASMILFQGQRGSFMVNWPFVYAATRAAVEGGSVDQSVLDNMRWTTYPRTTADTPSAPPLGGINIGVGARSEHQDLAWEAVRCITAPDKQAVYMVSDGNPAAAEAAYDDPTVQAEFPMADTIRESLENAAPRPQTPYYNEVSTSIQQGFTPPGQVNEQTPRTVSEDILAVFRGEKLL